MFFERILGWEGLLIEAGGDDYPHLKINRRCTIRGHSGCAHAALSDVENSEVFHHECNGGPCRHTVGAAEAAGDKRAHSVRTVTLNGLLARRAEVESVDLLSADCEGCEVAALRAFDFAKYRPSVVLLERQRNGRGKLSADMMALRSLLGAAGYYELADADGGTPFYFQDSFFLRADLASRVPVPCLDHLPASQGLPCPVADFVASERCARPGAWSAAVLNRTNAG